MKRWLSCILALVVAAHADNSKLAPDLQAAQPGSVISVIVRFTNNSPKKQLAAVAAVGATIEQDFSEIKAMAVSMPTDYLQQLSNDKNVAYISPDRPVFAFLDNTAQAVNAPSAWNLGLDGSGIGVAVVDSGVTDSPDLDDTTGKPRIAYSNSFVKGAGNPADSYGHGTHVAGIIAGNGSQSNGLYRGIAPGASLINLRVLDGQGQGNDSNVIAAILKAIKLKSKYNIRVLNLSLGRPVMDTYRNDPLCLAVEAAYQSGMVVVVAAGNAGRDNSFGNDGYATITSPGNDPYVITVGAVKTMGTPDRADDLIASYSSKGPTAIDHILKPDLVAPGNREISLNVTVQSLTTESPTRISTTYSRLVPDTWTSEQRWHRQTSLCFPQVHRSYRSTPQRTMHTC